SHVRVKGDRLPFVSRGGLKLQKGLDAFRVDPSGRICADLGASTGGFTDCLLQRGAARVYAIDVGYGQLAWKLRQDERVVVMERTNARHLDGLPEPVDLVVADLSFISVTRMLPTILRIGRPGAEAVLLIKPQFEAGPGGVGRGGRVKNAAIRSAAIADVISACETAGLRSRGTVPSPIAGAKAGNVEELVHLMFPEPLP
ncbi:MAG: TlyA family RNA methyltransferase, partial [Myxococcota bacterium]|nr:TlyA family RNA methyltransferase [Myxococcota bacterium]